MTSPAVIPAAARLYSRYVLAVLLVVYALNFLDRVVLGILVAPIKAELHLTDTELGLLGGTAFALFYTALGIPVGRLADRMNRVQIMTVALALWSACTALCGLAHNFLTLFLGRLMVGVGEAGGVAPAYSLLADYFPPHSRARAGAVYSIGIPLGSSLGILLGGHLAHGVGWRAVFVVLGIAGLALAPLLAATVREPTRGVFDDPVPAAAKGPTWRAVGAKLAAKPSFWLLALGAGCASLMGYGLLFWLPSFFMRSHGLTLPEVARLLGTQILIGGCGGLLLGGYLADRLGPQRPAAYALVPGFAFLAMIPCYALGTSLPLGVPAYLCFLIPFALQLMWLGPLITVIQQLVPPRMRALASAIFLFIINLLGLGLGSWLLGAASDRLAARFGTASLHYAILGGTIFYLIAAALMLLAAPRLAREFEHA
jgi:predicted MFS family arabinose efflux permease